MKFLLDTRLTLEQNAAKYFEKSKKAKKKLEGAKKALAMTHEKKKLKVKERVYEEKIERKKEWFEKFRWMITSDGFLLVGGRDASTNEAVVKKHVEPHDLVFHTDMAGSPFMVLKTEKKEPSKTAIEEAAQFTGSFSRAWKKGLGSLDVFYVRPDQLSKTAEAGEFIGKGAFMVRGTVNYIQPALGICIGKESSGRVMAAPEAAIVKHCGIGYQVTQGTDKISDVAKRLAKLLDADSNEIVPLLPAGGAKMGRKVPR